MESNDPPPDYNAQTVKQLRKVLEMRRNIDTKRLKRKAQIVAALTKDDRAWREAARLEQETLTASAQERGL
jgi:hypothetical protein